MKQSQGFCNQIHPLKGPFAFKRTIHPLLSTTAVSIVSNQDNRRNVKNDKLVIKRLLSAKDHRLKQAQNQLADAHLHLNTLANENRLLQSLQKRMDSALKRYESADEGIPRILNNHKDEIKLHQDKNKTLRTQLRETAQKLKEKETEYYKLNNDYKQLLALSKNMHLGEREKLQNQVMTLTEQIDKQSETIKTLQRKIFLENKKYNHQIHIEVLKHKETQLQLNDALNNIEKLNTELEKKEKIIISHHLKFGKKKMAPCKHAKHASIDQFDVEINQCSLKLNLPSNAISSSESQISLTTSSKEENTSGYSMCSANNKTILSNQNLFSNLEQIMNPFKKSDENNKDSYLETKMNHEKNHCNNSIHRNDSFLKAGDEHNLETNCEPKNNSDFQSKIQTTNMNDSSHLSHQDKSPSYKAASNDNKNKMNKQNSNIDMKILPFEKELEESTSDLQYIVDLNEEKIKCIHLEEKSLQQQILTENLLDNYCDNIVQTLESTFNIDKDKIKPKVEKVTKPNKINKILEVNNNKCNNNKFNEKKVTALDEEKKKKLLATLNAIDRGDDDGLMIEILKKKSQKQPHDIKNK